jgi:pilus assembly protein Flp/PilA
MVKLFVTLETLALAVQGRMRDEKGATAVEYGLMVGLIAVVIIAAVTLLGTELRSLFESISSSLSGAGGTTTA